MVQVIEIPISITAEVGTMNYIRITKETYYE